MNGWQRMWVFICVVLLIVMASFAATLNFPTAERIESYYAFDQYMYDTNLKCLETEAARRNAGINLPVSACTLDDPLAVKSKFAEDTARYEYRRDNLLTVQLQSMGWIIAGWVIVCVALYLLGLVLAWIVRGFRTKRINPS